MGWRWTEADMPGSVELDAYDSKRTKERIEELGRTARGEVEGVTVDSVDFRFIKFAAQSSCWCCYSIWGSNFQRLVGYSDRSFESHFTRNADDVLQILRMFVASATLECLTLEFDLPSKDDLKRLMQAVFPVVCTSRRLATLSFSVRESCGSWLLAAESGVRHFLETGFPVLLWDRHVICRLTVAREGTTVEYESSRPLKLVGGPDCRLVCSISRNQVTKDSKAGWTMVSRTSNPDRIPYSERGSAQEMFAVFPTDNALLKEVVLTRDWYRPGRNCCGSIDNKASGLVARNVTTIEQLEVGGYFISSKDSSLVADAEAVWRSLRSNRSLKEFHYHCTLAELHELVRVFVPDRGRESNSFLSTLRVHINGRPRIADCMVALAPLQGATVAALKQVIVCNANIGFTVMLMSSDDSQPRPGVGCVTLSRLKVRRDPSTWTWDHERVVHSLNAIEEVLRISTAVAHIEIVLGYQLDEFLVLQRTESCSDLQPNLPSSFSVLKLHLPPLYYRPRKASEKAVARCWMTVVKGLLRMVLTVERVEAVHKPDCLGPCDFEKGLQGKVGKGLKRLRKELRGNTCLQSLQVGWWRLVRVGAGDDEWEMRYDGPCLRRLDEYHVKVELQ